MAKITQIARNTDKEDDIFLNKKVDTSTFNEVENRYLKLLRKKQRLHLPLTASEKTLLNG